MCGVATALATSLLGGIMTMASGGGTKSYTPDEIPLNQTTPEPATPEPTLGVNNTDNAKTAQGRNSLVKNMNPGVSVGGQRSSGINVAKG